MRQTLFVIRFDSEIPLGSLGNLPVFGLGLLLAVWAVIGASLLYARYRETGSLVPSLYGAGLWSAVALAIFYAPHQQRLIGIPIFGYGFMLFLGFVFATTIASYRANRQGFPESAVWDLTFWVFLCGIGGARLWYVIQYSERYFGPGKNLANLINLPDGGLVFYGGLLGGVSATVIYCRVKNIPLLKLGDIAITSVFVGMMFGRMGCFLNGCCWGDACALPWAVTFPPESVPFMAEVQRGIIFPDAAGSRPLHPTQIYSAINALVLAVLTFCYYPYRHKDGAVLAVGWLAYPISRFTIEFLRNDEGGKWGTPFTPAQLFSFGLLATALAFLWYVARQPERSFQPPQPTPLNSKPKVKSTASPA